MLLHEWTLCYSAKWIGMRNIGWWATNDEWMDGWVRRSRIHNIYLWSACSVHTAVRVALCPFHFFLFLLYIYALLTDLKLFLKIWIWVRFLRRNIISGKKDLRDFIKMKRYLHFRMFGVNKIAYFFILIQFCPCYALYF